jgi:nucleotide-binding universal stress UspA family protein
MYKTVLLPVDLDQESSWRKALPAAVACCRAFGARLYVMTVVPDFGMSVVAQYFPEGYEKRMLDEANRELDVFVKDRVPVAVAAQPIVGHGTIYQEILRVAREVGVDLIVLASHRPELRDYLLGPNAARVVRHAEASVLVVRE